MNLFLEDAVNASFDCRAQTPLSPMFCIINNSYRTSTLLVSLSLNLITKPAILTTKSLHLENLPGDSSTEYGRSLIGGIQVVENPQNSNIVK